MDGTDPEGQPLVPARMLNEFAYCPRLMYLEWVEGLFADNPDTVSGRWAHRVVDEAAGQLPEAGAGMEETIHARSLTLSDPVHGLIARIDLVEGTAGAEGEVCPVDYKRGSPPDNPERCWEPERVQLCAAALILRHHGYRCQEGILYYTGSRERVRVPITDALVERTLELLREARAAAGRPVPPPPLVDSPKCPRCSLVGICLPDETHAVLASAMQPPVRRRHVRPLLPARPDAGPMYVTEQGALVGKAGERLEVRVDGKPVADVKLIDVSHVAVFGSVQVSTRVLQELAQREIPVTYHSHGGYFYGIFTGMPQRTAHARIRQFQVAADPEESLRLSRQLVRGKILNQRTLLRRNARDLPESVVPRLRGLAVSALKAKDQEQLLGIEGVAANLYYGHFQRMLSGGSPDFDFTERNRRPPKDPVNALLSLCYTLLAKDATVTLLAVGLDPYVGFYHRPGRGRPALALDLMEEFRPLIADSVVINVINRGIVSPGDFVIRGGAAALTPEGRRRVIEAYEQRMEDVVLHPIFGYRISYRRTLEVQARLLMRCLQGELPRYPSFLTR